MAAKKEVISSIETEKGSMKGLIIGVAVATMVAMVAGAGLGFKFSTIIPKTGDEKKPVAKTPEPVAEPYIGNKIVKTLKPIVTNLANPDFASWVRLEGAIIVDSQAELDFDELSAQVSQDTLAYLRTLTLMDLEGPSGLAYLRDDLNERAKTRSKGHVLEFVISSVVVE